MMKALLVVLTLCLMAGAQDASVVALDKQDAAHVKELKDAVDRAQNALNQFRDHIKFKYLRVPSKDPDAGNCSAPDKEATLASDSWLTATSCFHVVGESAQEENERTAACKKEMAEFRLGHPIDYEYRRDFGCGEFQFSRDYKYIVPAPGKPATWSNLGGCIVSTPTYTDVPETK